ncbi:MAG: anaerobic glycerol-3-phosphate dehydrogenase subunit GlpB [Bacillota bacterium]
MLKRHLACDVAVIGAGLSGLMAAAAARRKGASVLLLAGGHGALELSSGCIDLLGATPAGDLPDQPWEALPSLDPTHPYRLLGAERVGEAVAAFAQILLAEGLPYHRRADGRNQWTVTAIGRLRPTYLRPSSAACPGRGQRLWVAGFDGMAGFEPEVVAEGLRQGRPDLSVEILRAELPPLGASHPLQLARLLDLPAGRSALLRSLLAARPPGPAPDLILLPAVLGIDRSEEVREGLASALGAPVAEIPLPSPSLPGLRLSNRLLQHLERLGVDLRMGVEVTDAQVESGRVTALRMAAAGGAMTVKTGAVVLAAGGLLGRGIQALGRSLHEPIFGLPVVHPPQWALPELLPAGGHPFARCGLRTGADLRPEGYANLFACGRMLAGYDPYAEGSGGGVAIATGWRAGLLAGGEAA